MATIPTIPDMPAGHVATADDMNALSNAALWLYQNKPVASVHQSSNGQSIAASSTLITWDTMDHDNDSMWKSALNGRLTVQTPGWYKVRYMVGWSNAGSLISMNTYVQITTGPNNPAGQGITSFCWPGYSVGGSNNTTGTGAAGILPVYMFAGDYAQVFALANTSGSTVSTTYGFPFFSMELVSL